MDGKRQNNQLELAFMNEPEGEAPRPAQQGTEPCAVKRESESPAREQRLMEEVCERARQSCTGMEASPGQQGESGR
jgi:hypothetical protein